MFEQEMLGLLKHLVEKVDALEQSQNDIKQTQNDMKQVLCAHTQKFADIDATLAEHSQAIVRIAVTQENDVLPRIKALAEGQSTILAKMENDPRFQEMRQNYIALEDIVINLSNDVAKLKQA